MEHLSIGLVGCGGMGRRHLRAYKLLAEIGAARARVTAVCDVSRALAQDAADLAAQLLGSRPQVMVGVPDLLAAPGIDAVDVATDPASHHTVAVPALLAGRAVLCEKPLGVTVRACRAMVAAAERSGSLLATAENYRRDPPNQLARAVLKSGILGSVHAMVELHVGGDDEVIISPWRHLREHGSIALDMGVHFTDLFQYYLGDFGTVFGDSFIAEPVRRRTAAGPGQPLVVTATGDDSLVALYLMASGARVQLTCVPSGPGRQFTQRSVHGDRGAMDVPGDRTGGALVVTLGHRVLAGAELRHELGGFELTGVAARLFGPAGIEYDHPFDFADTALLAIELDDFTSAVIDQRPPEVDGAAGLMAVAAVNAVAESALLGQAVSVPEVARGAVSSAQDPIDEMLGLI
jgi:predicted dehydrogenase